jgi:hypothetical protein
MCQQKKRTVVKSKIVTTVTIKKMLEDLIFVEGKKRYFSTIGEERLTNAFEFFVLRKYLGKIDIHWTKKA